MATRTYITASSFSQPPWLKTLLEARSSPCKLYAWTPSNLENGQSYKQPEHLELDRRIYILGIGNLGRLFASYLSRHAESPPITLVVHRKELLAQWLQGDGVEITSREGISNRNKGFGIELWSEDMPVIGPIREVANGKKIQSLVIATKSWAAMTEADRLRGYLDSTSSVAFLQNGMSKLWPPDGPSYVSQRYPNQDAPNFLACVTNHGAYSTGPFSSVFASPADAVIGPVLLNETKGQTPSVDYLTKTIATIPGFDSSSTSKADLWVLQLQKLVVNATINPLTAVLRYKTGKLFLSETGHIADVINLLLAQTSAVLQALINDDSTTEVLASANPIRSPGEIKAVREQLTARFSQPELRSMLYRIGAIVKDNDSSMLQDARAGRTTEVRDFNGWIVDRATALQKTIPHLNVSAHRSLIDLVEARTVLTEAELHKHFISV